VVVAPAAPAVGPAAAPVEPAAPALDEPAELVARTARHTVSPMNSGVASDAELRRNNRACGTLKRAANRVHESFGNARCVEVHCGEGRIAAVGVCFRAAAGDAMASSVAATKATDQRRSMPFTVWGVQ